MKNGLTLFIALLLITNYQINAQEKTVSSKDLDYDRRNEQGLLMVNFEGKPYSGICQDTQPNGKVLIRGNYKDGLKDGIWSTYYNDGKIRLRENYLQGKRNGYNEEYLKNGDL